MAARIVHFGEDYHDHVQVLINSGYEVETCGTSLAKLNDGFRRKVDAVIVEEDGSAGEVDIVSVVRSCDWVPLVLFRGMVRRFDPLQFEAAISSNAPAREWLTIITHTIESSRAFVAECKLLTAQSAALREQSATVRQKSRAERRRARRLRSPSQRPSL